MYISSEWNILLVLRLCLWSSSEMIDIFDLM